ncbi:GDSL-type esterase/lipase family protein [Arenivirga flava]|uniref:SGNH hydrolase-type esterase domain-containing protein n=1 Tax=Arenivirga flava TaxID=1930060 RepID=A0AA37UDK9_9MICO|nr:GDSL-type esterase/lipase family protein [Arenivirga flava]GMA28653.1 hypothetical protein GCM10025874_19060 [Arenivirga flava]
MRIRRPALPIAAALLAAALAPALLAGTTESTLFTKPVQLTREHRIDLWRIENPDIEPGAIAFVGDSITAGFPLLTAFPEQRTINRGIPGDTSAQVLERMQESVYDLDPGIVVLMIGTNDLGHGGTVEQAVENTARIVRLVQANEPQAHILLQSVYPVYDGDPAALARSSVGLRTNDALDDINAALRALAGLAGVEYIDVNSALRGPDGLRAEYTVDGLHLSPAGYEAAATVLADVLR